MNRVKAQCVTSAKPRAMSEVRVQPVTGISVQGVTRIQFSVDRGLDCSPDSDWSGRGMKAVTDNGTQHGAGARAAEGAVTTPWRTRADCSLFSALLSSTPLSLAFI